MIYIYIHILISFLYYLYLRYKKDLGYIYKFVIFLFLPVFGIMFLILLAVSDKMQGTENNYASDVENAEDKIDIITRPDIEREINIIPVMDSLILNDSSTKKNMLINLLRDDKTKYIEMFKKTLYDVDTEASHYAAVALIEIKDIFSRLLDEFSMRYESEGENISFLREYADVLKKYLQSDLMDKKTRTTKLKTYSDILTQIIDTSNGEPQDFIDKIECDIETSDYKTTSRYCDKFLEEYAYSEDAHLAFLKTKYLLKDYTGFQEALKALMCSSIVLSNKALNIIRFWKEE